MDQPDPAMRVPSAIIDAATVERLAISLPYVPSPDAPDEADQPSGSALLVTLADVARSFMWVDKGEPGTYEKVARFAVSLLTYIDRDLDGLLEEYRLPNLSDMLDEAGSSDQLTGLFLAAYRRAVTRKVLET